MGNCGSYIDLMHASDFAEWKKALSEGSIATAASYVVHKVFINHVGDTSEIIFFLLGAMTTSYAIRFVPKVSVLCYGALRS